MKIPHLNHVTVSATLIISIAFLFASCEEPSLMNEQENGEQINEITEVLVPQSATGSLQLGDLQARFVSITNSPIFDTNTNVARDKNLIVSLDIGTNGPVSFDHSHLQLFLSTDAQVDTTDHLINKVLNAGPFVSTSAGGTLFRLKTAIEFIVPEDFPLGVYHLGFIVDPNNIIPEPNESNNIFVSPVTITIAELPDLTTTEENLKFEVNAQTLFIEASITNIGNIASNNTKGSVSLLDVNSFFLHETHLHDFPIPSIEPGEVVMLTIPVDLQLLPGGSYELLFRVDDNNQISELNEYNNLSDGGELIEFAGLPNLQTTQGFEPSFSPAAPNAVVPGEMVTINFPLEYESGNEPVGSFNIIFTLVELGSDGNNPIHLAKEGVDAMLPSQFIELVVQAAIPSNTPDGNYSIHWHIDAGLDITESNEGDNTGVISGILRIDSN